jgi:phosphatidylserine decarboxylase
MSQEMALLAQGHETGTLALITLFPLFFFYGLVYPILLIISVLILFLLVGHMFFFRDPGRKVKNDPQLIITPADGKIYEIDGKEGVIRIRMSLFSVHVNRAPVSGKIIEIISQRGKYWPFFSFLHQGTLDNARQIIHIENSTGKYQVIQIAGMIARRCTSYYKVGDQIEQGERIGMVHYGSEVDVQFPPEKFEIIINKGAKTVAGITPLAKLKRK